MLTNYRQVGRLGGAGKERMLVVVVGPLESSGETNYVSSLGTIQVAGK